MLFSPPPSPQARLMAEETRTRQSTQHRVPWFVYPLLLGMRASSPGGTTQARPMKRARKSTTYDYAGPLVLPAYGHERQKQRRSHGSFQVPAASRPSAPRDPPPAVSKPALRKPPPAAPARLAVQRVWDRAQYAWPRVKQALEEEYDLVLTEAADETAGLAAWSKLTRGCPPLQLRLAGGCRTEREAENQQGSMSRRCGVGSHSSGRVHFVTCDALRYPTPNRCSGCRSS